MNRPGKLMMIFAEAGVTPPLPKSAQRETVRQATPVDAGVVFIFMPQPCCPSRRQQAGSLASESADHTGAVSVKLKSASNKMAGKRCKP